MGCLFIYAAILGGDGAEFVISRFFFLMWCASELRLRLPPSYRLFPCCLSTCPISLSSCPLSLSTPDPPGNSAQLAEKLKLSDPLVLERRHGDRDLEPDWLVQLRRQHKALEVSTVVPGALGTPCFSDVEWT